MPNNLANAVEVSSDQHSTTVQLSTGVSADLVTAMVKDGNEVSVLETVARSVTLVDMPKDG
jgi:hypothetical protein